MKQTFLQMPGDPNKLSRFWQELKRRKVVRVVTVYAAAAFVILELVSIIIEPLRLPEWFLSGIIVLLCAGFILAVILSWIYDVTPEGLEKTIPADQSANAAPASSYRWRIASMVSFIVIAGLIILQFASPPGHSGETPALEKSIAVLPFINDSPDDENAYFINGAMEAILDNLSKIKDLRVVSRTSVEQYRNTPKPIPVIATEMNVSYVLEGSGQRDGNHIRLTLQLIDAVNDKHIWSNPIIREIEVGNIFVLQSEIAQLVAREIEVLITPEEKELIEKVPTTNRTAYDLFHKAISEREKFMSDPDYMEGLDRAKELLHYAIEFDTSYADPYVTLGWIYWDQLKNWGDTASYLWDSIVSLTERVIELNPEHAGAHHLQGFIYKEEGKRDLAIKAFDRAIELNPNFGAAFAGKGWIYYDRKDFVNAISHFYKSILLERTSDLWRRYQSLSTSFAVTGFFELAENYNQEILKLTEDTAYYYYRLANLKSMFGNYDEAIECASKGYSINPDYIVLINSVGFQYLLKGQYTKSFDAYQTYFEKMDSMGIEMTWGDMGAAFIYLKNGNKKKADELMDIQVSKSEEMIRNNRSGVEGGYYYLAAANAIRGDKSMAIENLRHFNQQEGMEIYVMTFRNHPFFENIRNIPEFQQLVSEMEAKYQAEHEKVRIWLEENDMVKTPVL